MNNNKNYNDLLTRLQKLEKVIFSTISELKAMYKRNSVDSYYTFRTFMMGTKGTSMFPKGIIYEGVNGENEFV